MERETFATSVPDFPEFLDKLRTEVPTKKLENLSENQEKRVERTYWPEGMAFRMVLTTKPSNAASATQPPTENQKLVPRDSLAPIEAK